MKRNQQQFFLDLALSRADLFFGFEIDDIDEEDFFGTTCFFGTGAEETGADDDDKEEESDAEDEAESDLIEDDREDVDGSGCDAEICLTPERDILAVASERPLKTGGSMEDGFREYTGSRRAGVKVVLVQVN